MNTISKQDSEGRTATGVAQFIGGPNFGPQNIVIVSGGAKTYVSIHADGTIEYGEDYKPDEAAQAFWAGVGRVGQLYDAAEDMLAALIAARGVISEKQAPLTFQRICDAITKARGATP